MGVDIGVEVLKDKEFVIALNEVVADRMEIAEGAVSEFIDDEAGIGIAGVFIPSGVGAVFVVGKDFAGFEAEDNDIVIADSLADFDVCAVKGADSDSTVHHEFHIAGTGGFFGGGGDLFRDISGGVNDFADRYAEVFDKEDF